MQIHHTIDVTAFHRVAPTRSQAVQKDGEQASGQTERQPLHAGPRTGMSAKINELDYTQTVEPVRELSPVNVHPKHRAAIDTLLTIAHYDGGDSIINTYA